jgi:hypothetical protein
MAGDTAKAKTGYQDFFALWKDADPDIPILKQAKAEYAKLQSSHRGEFLSPGERDGFVLNIGQAASRSFDRSASQPAPY